MEQTDYFVHVRDPEEIRKALLNTSKQTIHILQRVERIKHLRAKKMEKIFEIKKTNKEIRLLINKLKKALPAAGVRISTKNNEQERRKINGNELKELEEELKLIEGKIGQLN